MPDYSKGKVYKIVGNGKVYVGSTTKTLARRLSCHRSFSKRGIKTYNSFECFSDPKCRIELVEECCCETKKELLECERKWIEALECVNKKTPGRTGAEWYQDNKKYYKEYQKEYREQNREQTNQKQREYRARKKLLANNSVVTSE